MNSIPNTYWVDYYVDSHKDIWVACKLCRNYKGGLPDCQGIVKQWGEYKTMDRWGTLFRNMKKHARAGVHIAAVANYGGTEIDARTRPPPHLLLHSVDAVDQK